jgi:hypothetical protein
MDANENKLALAGIVRIVDVVKVSTFTLGEH